MKFGVFVIFIENYKRYTKSLKGKIKHIDEHNSAQF